MHPVVTKIIKIKLQSETEIENIREVIYAGKFDDTTNAVFQSVYGERYLEEYRLRDGRDYQTYKREKSGHPAAEKKAEELRKIIEHSKTEEEILAAIAAMETAETKDDTE